MGALVRIMCTFQFVFLPESVVDLRARITDAVAEVTPAKIVAPGKKFIVGGVFAVLHMEVSETVTLIYQAKLDVFGYSSV
jgi:hypothetical protein